MRPIPNVSQNRTVIRFARNPVTRAEEQKSNKKSFDEAFERTTKRGPVTWASLALVALAGGGLLLYVRYLKEEKERSKKASNFIFFSCFHDEKSLNCVILFSVMVIF